MIRRKRRYILLRHSRGSFSPNRRWMRVVYSEPPWYIVRVPHLMKHEAIELLNSIPGTKTLKTSGTIKKLKKWLEMYTSEEIKTGTD